MANSSGVITLATARRCEARRDFALAAHHYALLTGRILSASRRQVLRGLQMANALRAVEAWNQLRPIGTPILYVPTLAPPFEEPSEAGVTLSLARVSDAGHPVLFVSCRTGYVALSHVRWQWQPQCALCLCPSPAEGYLWPRCACTEEATCATCVARAGAIGVVEGPIRTSLGRAPNCPACVEPEIEGISCRALRGPGEAHMGLAQVVAPRCSHKDAASALSCAKGFGASLGRFHLAMAVRGDEVLRAALAVCQGRLDQGGYHVRACWLALAIEEGRLAPPRSFREGLERDAGAHLLVPEKPPGADEAASAEAVHRA